MSGMHSLNHTAMPVSDMQAAEAFYRDVLGATPHGCTCFAYEDVKTGAAIFKSYVIGDFLLDKDPLFARLTLNEDELALYQKIYDSLRPRAPAPDTVIYLQASAATLVERVRRRAKGYERPVTEEYLELLAESYARFFYHYDAAPLLIVNSENLNFVERDGDFELLVARLRAMRTRREFFSLA